MQPLFAFEHPSCTARLLMYDSYIPCVALGSPRCPAHEDLARGVFSSNPFYFMQLRTLPRNGASETPFHQSLPHSFPCNGGGRVSVARPLATRRSPRATVNPVFAAHPKNRQLTSLFATHPKTGSRKSLVCHTYDTLRGAVHLFLPNSGRLQQPIAGQQRAALLVFSHQSPITIHESPVTAIRPIACTIARCHNCP